MSKSPRERPAMKRAARMLPSAYGMRLPARWLISIRSPVPAKSTVWSPTMSPPRTAAKPIVPALRSPVSPSRA